TQQRHGTPGTPTMLGDPALDEETRWTLALSTSTLPWLDDHIVDGSRMLPGAAYLDAALSVAALDREGTTTRGGRCAAVEDVHFIAPLIIEAGDVPLFEVRLEKSTGRLTMRSRPALGAIWTEHATARLVDGDYEPTTITVPDTTTMAPAD